MALFGVRTVVNNITSIFERRKAAVYAKSLFYAARALQDFRSRQGGNEFWQNRTGTAKDLVSADAYQKKNIVGWVLAHGVQYGVYLELANNRKHEALRPMINKWSKPFFEDLKKLYGDSP
jgi:hypothetical protein